MVPDHNEPARSQPSSGPKGPRWRQRVTHWVRVAVAMVLLAVTAAAQRFIPMPRWSSVLGRPTSVPDAWRASPVMSLPSRWDSPAELRAATAVRSARRHLPWKPRCLAEAATAQLLLRAMGSPAVVVIGLRPPAAPTEVPNDNPSDATPVDRPDNRSSGHWEAHAWLVGRSGAITGGPAARGFTATTVFEVPGGLTATEVASSLPSP